jgi:hypothetical protein
MITAYQEFMEYMEDGVLDENAPARIKRQYEQFMNEYNEYEQDADKTVELPEIE